MTNRPERLADLLARELPPNPAYIEPKVLTKGGTLLLGGAPKVGKSFIALDFARTLTTGGNLFLSPTIYAPEPVKVLLIEQEVGMEGLQDRGRGVFKHEKIELYGDRMWYVSKEPDLLLDTSVGKKLLYDLVAEVRPNVLILDPLGQMHTADENDAAAMAKLFNYLDALKKDFAEDNLSIVMSHHFRKPPIEKKGWDPLDPNNYRGSGRFFGNPDTIMTNDRFEELRGMSWKAWKLRCRFVLRHGSGPDDFTVVVQQNNDHRVIFERELKEAQKLDRDTAAKNEEGLPVSTQRTFNLV